MYRSHRTHPSIPAGLLVALVALACALVGAAPGGAAVVTVAPGETLSAIAARHGVDPAAVARLNGLADPDRIVAGTRLRLPGAGARSRSAPAAGGGYRVRPGDTMGAIAARLGVSVAALARANGISRPDRIVAGTVLRVPGGGAPAASAPRRSGGSASTHRVRPGETLGAIAARHGVSVAALARANGLGDPNAIVAGRVLRIPAAGGGAPARSRPAGGRRVARGDVGAIIDSAARRHGVDPALARALAWQESGWNQAAVSSAGAVGVMQLMPATAAWIGRDILGRRLDRSSVVDNVEGGVAFLAWLTRQTGDTRSALAAYYQGLGALRSRGPFDDTRAYVRNVLALRGTV